MPRLLSRSASTIHPVRGTGDQRVRCLPLLAGKIDALLQKENAWPNHYNPHSHL